MSCITENRVIIASLFLPYTVDFHINDKRKPVYTPANLEQQASGEIPNLIQSLAAQRHSSVHTAHHKTQQNELFELQRPEKLMQPSTPSYTDKTRASPLREKRRASLDRKFADAPWSAKLSIAGNIGLQNAVHSIRHKLNDLIWVGTLGMPTDALPQQTKDRICSSFKAEHNAYPVIPTDAEFEGHYNRYCKQVLWPYFHYVVQDDVENMMLQDKSYKAYRAVNQRFADVIVENYREGDIIWVNDYHLMLLPGMLREKLPHAIIGFFLHIPFPSSELFRCLPPRKQLLEAMLQSDLIGFQTYSFARHFIQTCARILSLDTTPSGIHMDSHYVSIGIYPIGIDVKALNKKREKPEVRGWIDMLKDKYAGKKLIVARDKLDYIKGVRQKLLAFEQFLIRHPEWRGEVVLIQIALSTSEQNELRAHISDVVSRVNSKFSNISYQPIVFLHQDISFSQYLALLTAADVSLITPLRDGMNLTSHEYIVCQEERCNPLILSEFTGTYGSFGACLRVNPWDYRQVGDAIHEALSMNQEEKVTRWNELYKSIIANSAQNFATTIISELCKVRTDPGRRFSAKVPSLDTTSLQKAMSTSKKRLFLFDYGGTLVPYGLSGDSKDLRRLKKVLHQLVKDPCNSVYVISGRTKLNVERDLGDIPNLGLSAENGFYLKPRSGDWEQLFGKIDLSWQPAVKEIFQYYTERTPDAYIETKDVSIVWHYRTRAGPDAHYIAWQAAECQNHIADSVNKNFAVRIVAGHTNIEVLPAEITKSNVINRIFQDIQPDFVLSIGDDRSDEDMFAYLNKQKGPRVFTCTVGMRSTDAKYYIPNVEEVLCTIESLV
ncbi:glycosyltransferase family 20-domain-containing protein [Radiomyces spectabilis]|uniref:glycosyltransferase family 20-domain-containing protein n=1 Tax=Radiomyces spectabilis TaxID=64574 RepID=UPI002220F1B7|nr:glycosyltransferase family 20-domain-containing protein [Radiomyces spectabilis]KAI8372791.1 glycosyltransferase family 20-domain-containing protein [Radiomyces spectabilis]